MNGTGGADLTVDIRNQHRGEFALTARMAAAGGETIAVMGPSGAGKSTLLALVAGRLRLQAGRIGIAGRVVSSPQRHVPAAARDVVMLGQDPLLFPHLNVRENIAFGRRARGIARGQARDEAEQWLARIGLPGTGDRMPADLSGGQQQRVALARALITQPRVLLLDEPLTSLDAITAHEVRAVLQPQLRQATVTAAPMTTVMVTHDALDATALADRLVLIESGAVTHDGPVREVLAAPRTDFAASIVGVNRLPGSVLGEDAGASVIIRPGDVHLNLVSDSGSADAGAPESRSWRTRIARLEQTPTGVRAYLDEPTLFVDLAVDEALTRGLVAGAEVNATVREWRVVPAVAPTA